MYARTYICTFFTYACMHAYMCIAAAAAAAGAAAAAALVGANTEHSLKFECCL